MNQFKYINGERGIRPTAVGALARKNLPLAGFLTLALRILFSFSTKQKRHPFGCLFHLA